MTFSKLRKLKFLVWMFLVLSLKTTNATAQSQVLRKNERAPFAGVLVSDETYRLMTIDIEKSDLLMNQYSDYVAMEDERESKNMEFFALGTAAGVALTFIIVAGARK